MIEHIVLFRWKAEATAGQIETAMASLRGLAGRIPGILGLTCGEDFSGRSKGYTHALVVRFADRTALGAYGPHPAHREVFERDIAPIRDETLGFDFQVRP